MAVRRDPHRGLRAAANALGVDERVLSKSLSRSTIGVRTAELLYEAFLHRAGPWDDFAAAFGYPLDWLGSPGRLLTGVGSSNAGNGDADDARSELGHAKIDMPVYTADPRSPEEQDFRNWYQARAFLPPGRRQDFAQYAAMTGVDKLQMRRWLPSGVDSAVIDAREPGKIPDPAKFVTGKDWLTAMRRYLGLSPQQMDRVIGAEPGAWALVEFGALQATGLLVRALLRRVPEARSAYFNVGQRFPR